MSCFRFYIFTAISFMFNNTRSNFNIEINRWLWCWCWRCWFSSSWPCWFSSSWRCWFRGSWRCWFRISWRCWFSGSWCCLFSGSWCWRCCIDYIFRYYFRFFQFPWNFKFWKYWDLLFALTASVSCFAFKKQITFAW